MNTSLGAVPFSYRGSSRSSSSQSSSSSTNSSRTATPATAFSKGQLCLAVHNWPYAERRFMRSQTRLSRFSGDVPEGC